MNNLMRNLTLSAAALAALVTFAPKAAADEYGRGREGGRHEWREHAHRGPGRCAYAPPVRIVYGPRCAVPFRIHHGRRLSFIGGCWR